MALDREDIQGAIEALAMECRQRQETAKDGSQKAFENGYMGGLMDARDVLLLLLTVKARLDAGS